MGPPTLMGRRVVALELGIRGEFTDRGQPGARPKLGGGEEEKKQREEEREKGEMEYSGTSDKGPSEIGTTSIQRTLVAAPLVYYFTSEIGTTSLQGTKLLATKCPLFKGSTVYSRT